jgi:hypothetical protein
MAILRRMFKYEPINSVEARKHVAAKVIEAGKYVV